MPVLTSNGTPSFATTPWTVCAEIGECVCGRERARERYSERENERARMDPSVDARVCVCVRGKRTALETVSVGGKETRL